jgi:hypothetical protein
MTDFTTETGYYVLVDGDEAVIAKADVSVGTHPVSETVDISKSFDVTTASELEDYTVGDTV